MYEEIAFCISTWYHVANGCRYVVAYIVYVFVHE